MILHGVNFILILSTTRIERDTDNLVLKMLTTFSGIKCFFYVSLNNQAHMKVLCSNCHKQF